MLCYNISCIILLRKGGQPRQRGDMPTTYLWVEQRPWFGGGQRRGCRGHLRPVTGVGLARGLEVVARCRHVDLPERQHHVAHRGTRPDALPQTASDAGILWLRNLLAELAPLVADGIDGDGDDGGIALADRGIEHADESGDFGNLAVDRLGRRRLGCVADGIEIGHEIGAFRRRQAKYKMSIEVADDLLVAVEAAVVEIRRIEVGVDQRLGLEPAARTDVVHLVIDEGARWRVTTGTAHRRLVRK